MNTRNRLELTWVGKDQRPRLEPRILLEEPELSYHAAQRISAQDQFDNLLIHGDNLLALKALEAEYAGKIKCVFIDPPYNTGQAFPLYDDGVEHSEWLCLIRDRVEQIHRLLSTDGLLFCQLNDDEMAYGKVLLDEVFGRANFINQVSVKMKLTAGASGGGEDKRLKKNVEYLLVYAKDRNGANGFEKFNDVYDEEELIDYIADMEDQGKSWKYTSILLEKGQFIESRTIFDGAGEPILVSRYRGVRRTTVNALEKQKHPRQQIYFENFDTIFSDTNAQTSIRTRIIDEFQSLGDDEMLEAEYVPRSGRDKGETVRHYYVSPTIRRVIWLKDTAVKRGKRILKLEKAGTLWTGFSLNNLTKEGGVAFPNGKKPEALVQKVLALATNPGDLVLDSFAGSGTTGAVAHKMGRRWIMVELGEHAKTHIVPRLRKVIDGTDPGGVTEAAGWKGGGGFRFMKLAPSLLKKNAFDHWVISPDYNPEMLAQAVCTHLGFKYQPRPDFWWMMGQSSERDFICVTTASLTHEDLRAISDEVGDGRSLLICCKAFMARTAAFENLTVQKIPQTILHRCEWGRDDYSLRIAELPQAAPESPQPQPPTTVRSAARAAQSAAIGDLFDPPGDAS